MLTTTSVLSEGVCLPHTPHRTQRQTPQTDDPGLIYLCVRNLARSQQQLLSLTEQQRCRRLSQSFESVQPLPYPNAILPLPHQHVSVLQNTSNTLFRTAFHFHWNPFLSILSSMAWMGRQLRGGTDEERRTPGRTEDTWIYVGPHKRRPEGRVESVIDFGRKVTLAAA